ncbi:MAG: UPF0182 family protein [Clostridiales Family XIII bacterium]|nr:UPF0182 family protein [Clostridiales Family XIII bacterium]
MKKNTKPILTIVVIILLGIVAGFSGLIGFVTDYLWFKELGYIAVFFKQLFTQLKIGVPTFILLAVLAYIYLQILKKSYFKKVKTLRPPINSKILNWIALALAAVFSAAITWLAVTSLWFEILKFTNSSEFGLLDPVFNLDVSFYVFRLQFITELNRILIGVLVAFAILTFLYYFILIALCRPKIFDAVENAESADGANSGGAYGSFNDIFGKFGEAFNKMGGGGAFSSKQQKTQFNSVNFKELLSIASSQIGILGVIFFLAIGVNFFLKQYDLLYSHTGVLYGAGFTDINVTLWIYRAMIALSVLAAIFFAASLKRKKYRSMLTIPVIMIVFSALGSGASTFVQNLVVSPDEINKESQDLAYNIEFTQKAYGLNNVVVKPFAAENNLTKEDIQNNMETISNIRINDYTPAEQFYNQTQSIRQYYAFDGVDVDRYMVNGEYTQTFLSAREIDESKIRQEWLNTHLKYTHGYGITLSRVDKVTASGQPDMLIRNIPPVSDVAEINITRPEIYFGELTNNYILTNTDEEEFDYPDGENNTYTIYEGTAGIKLNPLNKILFAIREQSMKLLVSSNITSDSKILINRNIKNRVSKIMPYLSYDQDPYIVTADGKLYWILDAYTTSAYYPYSEPFNSQTDINYIRNSVKIVIDAYNGNTDYYLVDENDPVANTYMKIYPSLFKTFDQMPESLRQHVRYPNQILNIQANVYKRYHMTDVKVFYQGEDLWDISKEIFGTEEVSMTPNYYIMKIPGEERVEFINSIPYTPKDKVNMTGLLVARNDGDKYGELILYQLPKNKIIYGPMQIEAQINQHTTISKEFSLWTNAGSKYNRGNMFVIPIEQSLVYVEPVYLEAENSSLPEVKRVIVAYGDRIAYEPTLAAALDSLFGSGAGTQAESGSSDEPEPEIGEFSDEQLIQMANAAYTNAVEAQRLGDWTTYGAELKKLEQYLSLLLPEEDITADETANNVLAEEADTLE